jgi:predicted permease
MNWWWRVRNRWRLEDQLDAELRFHFDQLVTEYMQAGATEADARRRARSDFGGVEQIKEACREVRGTRWIHEIDQDIRFAARLLTKERSLTVLAVLALAMGIGVNNAMFTLVEAICIRGLPISHADRVADVAQSDQTHAYLLISPRQYKTLEDSTSRTPEIVAAYTSRSATVTDERNAAERVTVAYVSPQALSALGKSVALGRNFEPADARTGAPPVAILSHSLWRTRYDTSPAVGTFLRINGSPVLVIGVMPEGFKFPDAADVWAPIAALPLQPDARVLHVYARISDGSTMLQAQERIDAVLSGALPLAEKPQDLRTMVVPINARYNGDITNPAWIAFITVGLLLVIVACSNVANLLLARGVRRHGEIAIRLSLGATRVRIMRQLLVESTLLALCGGLGAIGVSWVALQLLDAAIPPGALPFWITLTMDWRVAAVLAAVCLGTVLLFGFAPALRLAQTSLNEATKESGGSTSHDRATGRWTWGFLTCQLALTVLLVSKLGFTLEGFYALQTREPFIDGKRVMTFGVALPQNAYQTEERRVEFYRALADRLRVRSSAIVSVAASLPSQPGTPRRIVPVDESPSTSVPPVSTMTVDSDYFHALGLDLRAGRPFARGSLSDLREAIIVNQRFADLFFHGASAVGRRVRVEAEAGPRTLPADLRTIVGLAPSLRQQPSVEAPPIVYMPLAATGMANAKVLVRGPADGAVALASAIRDEVRHLDPDVPVTDLMTLEDANWSARWNARVSGGILATLVSVAVALATIGLIALTAFGVAQRKRELGIRLAFGAKPSHVVTLTLRRVVLQVVVGLLCGSLLSIVWTAVFEGAKPSAAMLDNLAATALILAAVMLTAAAWPARAAARLDPLSALKSRPQ